ncbi:MAG: biotin transporter BioY [Elusimicrobia bacterium]|nr:biotin transporter BioY [Elusimicrobiota bacterium]
MIQSQTYPTLVQAVLPKAGAAARFGEALGFSLLIALSAQLAVPLPFTPVPLTAQTAAVMLAGALLGRRWGAASVMLYLLEGAAGLPFFAGASGGALCFAGPTGGYLLAFPLAAYVTGFFAERGFDRTFLRAAAAMLAGSVIILSIGTLALARFVPAGKVFQLGFLPFIPGDILKIGISAAALPLGWRLLGKDR